MEDQYHTCFFPVFWYLSSSWIFKNNCKWFNCKYALYFFHWMQVYLWCMSSQIANCEHKLSKYFHILIKMTFLQSLHYFNRKVYALLIFSSHLLLSGFMPFVYHRSFVGFFGVFLLLHFKLFPFTVLLLIIYSVFLKFSMKLTWNRVSVSNVFSFSQHLLNNNFVLYKRKHWI